VRTAPGDNGDIAWRMATRRVRHQHGGSKRGEAAGGNYRRAHGERLTALL